MPTDIWSNFIYSPKTAISTTMGISTELDKETTQEHLSFCATYVHPAIKGSTLLSNHFFETAASGFHHPSDKSIKGGKCSGFPFVKSWWRKFGVSVWGRIKTRTKPNHFAGWNKVAFQNGRMNQQTRPVGEAPSINFDVWPCLTHKVRVILSQAFAAILYYTLPKTNTTFEKMVVNRPFSFWVLAYFLGRTVSVTEGTVVAKI